MAFSFNGLGTCYRGERDFHPDGSYITTEWIVVLFVPLLPLRSFRLIHVPEADEHYIIYSSKKFLIVERQPIHTRQAFATYGFMLALLAWAVLLIWIAAVLGTPWNRYPAATAAGIVTLVGGAFIIPMSLRKRAKAAVPFSKAALSATLNRLGIVISQDQSAPKTAVADNRDGSGTRATHTGPNVFDY